MARCLQSSQRFEFRDIRSHDRSVVDEDVEGASRDAGDSLSSFLYHHSVRNVHIECRNTHLKGRDIVDIRFEDMEVLPLRGQSDEFRGCFGVANEREDDVRWVSTELVGELVLQSTGEFTNIIARGQDLLRDHDHR